MKKENKKLAQERKALERQAAQKKALTKKILTIALPAALLLALIGIGYLVSAHSNQAADANVSVNGANTPDTAPTLNTDADLTVEDGDVVNIDYVGTVDGVEFAGGSTGGSGTDLTIGSGMYIDDFEQQLIGAHAGDTVEVVVTFPDNYGVDELNGKEAVFTTVINGIYK